MRSLAAERWATGSMLAVSVPVFLAWLVGHAIHAAIRPESALVAACFALALGGCARVRCTGKGLLPLLLPQVVAIAYLIFLRQPVASAGVTLLASAQLLWAPQLQTPMGHTAYRRAVQITLAASMLLSAWTLGHGP